jgi:hypothetical protein
MQPDGEIAFCATVKDLPKYFAEHELGQCQSWQKVADFALESIRAVNVVKVDSVVVAQIDPDIDGQSVKTHSTPPRRRRRMRM